MVTKQVLSEPLYTSTWNEAYLFDWFLYFEHIFCFLSDTIFFPCWYLIKIFWCCTRTFPWKSNIQACIPKKNIKDVFVFLPYVLAYIFMDNYGMYQNMFILHQMENSKFVWFCRWHIHVICLSYMRDVSVWFEIWHYIFELSSVYFNTYTKRFQKFNFYQPIHKTLLFIARQWIEHVLFFVGTAIKIIHIPTVILYRLIKN